MRDDAIVDVFMDDLGVIVVNSKLLRSKAESKELLYHSTKQLKLRKEKGKEWWSRERSSLNTLSRIILTAFLI